MFAQQPSPPPFNSATISGLGARNIGSAAMSGRISAIAGTREPSGKVTLFVGAASGGVWKSDDQGTRYRPVFDEQSVQSIGAIALDPKNSKNVWVGTGESWTRNSVSIGDGIYKSTDGGETKLALLEGQPQGLERPIGIRRIAFRIGGDDFIRLIEELDALKGSDAVNRSEIADHGKSFSVYFSDPYGNQLEVTTYDYEAVRAKLG